jgi:hypothetical protein
LTGYFVPLGREQDKQDETKPIIPQERNKFPRRGATRKLRNIDCHARTSLAHARHYFEQAKDIYRQRSEWILKAVQKLCLP